MTNANILLKVLLVCLTLFIFMSAAFATINNQPSPFVKTDSMAPAGVDDPCSPSVIFSNNSYFFACGSIQYKIDTANTNVKKGMLVIQELSTNSTPADLSGPRYRNQSGTVLWPNAFASSASSIFENTLWPNNAVSLKYTQTYQSMTTILRYDIQLVGKTLVVHAYAENPSSNPFGNYEGFVFDRASNVPNARPYTIPYMDIVPVVIAGNPGSEFFYSTTFDWGRSNSNDFAWVYGPKSTGVNAYSFSRVSGYKFGLDTIQPGFDETLYVTVSPTVYDVMQAVHRSPTPYRNLINNSIFFDLWGINSSAWGFSGNNQNERAKSIMDLFQTLGMKEVWFNDSYWGSKRANDPSCNSLHPEFTPPQDIPGLQAIAADAKLAGYFWGVYEIYNDMYQKSKYYNSNEIRRDSSGNPTFGYLDPSCNPPNPFQTQLDKMLNYASVETPSIHSTVQTTSGFIDVIPKNLLATMIDFSTTNLNSRTFAQAVASSKSLLDYMSSTIQGPMAGEGGQSTDSIHRMVAGNIDALEGEIVGRQNAPIIVDAEIRQFKKYTIGQGMGYRDRWIGTQEPTVMDDAFFQNFPWDQYRAQTIAFNHSGFMATYELAEPTFTGTKNKFIPFMYQYFGKEYYTFRNLQNQYLSSDATSTLYNSPQGMVNLDSAMKQNIDFNNSQLKLNYANGLELYVNMNKTQNWTVTSNSKSYTLPPFGWVATNRNVSGYGQPFYENYSALVNGRRVDFASTPEFVMADGRGTPTDFGVIQTTNMEALIPGEAVFCSPSAGCGVSSTCGDGVCGVNEDSTICPQDCKIDTLPPSGSISINSGDDFAPSIQSNLSLTFSDNVGVKECSYSNDDVNFSLPEACSSSKQWNLSPGVGVKTVYYKITDTSNLSTVLSDAITLLQCSDSDHDGYFAYDSSACLIGNDCDDLDASIHLGAKEICQDGIDQDCSGSDALCSANGNPETPPSSTENNSAPPSAPSGIPGTIFCGNKSCESNETRASCPADCSALGVCGNQVCEFGENSSSCPRDCAKKIQNVCGDGICSSRENATSCPVDCEKAVIRINGISPAFSNTVLFILMAFSLIAIGVATLSIILHKKNLI